MILAIIFFGAGAIGLTIFMIDTSSIDALPTTAILWIIFLALLIVKIAQTIDERQEEQKINEYYRNRQQYIVAPYHTFTEAKTPTIIEKEPAYQQKSLVTPAEEEYARAIQYCLPIGYILQPQVCLASIVKKTANTQHASELFRIIDFGIFDENYQIKALIEINDNSHLEANRRKRDSKVKKICEEAQIPLVTFWMHYGVDYRYIEKRIRQALYQ